MSETNPDTELSTINYPIEMTVKIGPKRWWRRRTTILTGSGDIEFPMITTPSEDGTVNVSLDVANPVTAFLLGAAETWEDQAPA